jgi:hypothetical protein
MSHWNGIIPPWNVEGYEGIYLDGNEVSNRDNTLWGKKLTKPSDIEFTLDSRPPDQELSKWKMKKIPKKSFEEVAQ